GSHALQHLVSVQVRHHDVQQYEVKGLRAQKVERFVPIGCSGYVVIALDIELQGERVAIVLVVIDNEQRRVGDTCNGRYAILARQNQTRRGHESLPRLIIRPSSRKCDSSTLTPGPPPLARSQLAMAGMEFRRWVGTEQAPECQPRHSAALALGSNVPKEPLEDLPKQERTFTSAAVAIARSTAVHPGQAQAPPTDPRYILLQLSPVSRRPNRPIPR